MMMYILLISSCFCGTAVAQPKSEAWKVWKHKSRNTEGIASVPVSSLGTVLMRSVRDHSHDPQTRISLESMLDETGTSASVAPTVAVTAAPAATAAPTGAPYTKISDTHRCKQSHGHWLPESYTEKECWDTISTRDDCDSRAFAYGTVPGPSGTENTCFCVAPGTDCRDEANQEPAGSDAPATIFAAAAATAAPAVAPAAPVAPAVAPAAPAVVAVPVDPNAVPSPEEIEDEEITAAAMMSQVTLYRCCEKRRGNTNWQASLKVDPQRSYGNFAGSPALGGVPPWCKRQWYTTHCYSSDAKYMPDSGAPVMGMTNTFKTQACQTCYDCVSSGDTPPCDFWAEDQAPVPQRWLDKIPAEKIEEEREVVQQPAAPELGADDEEVVESEKDADKLAKEENGTSTGAEDLEETEKSHPFLSFIFVAAVLGMCGAGVVIVKRQKEAEELMAKEAEAAAGMPYGADGQAYAAGVDPNQAYAYPAEGQQGQMGLEENQWGGDPAAQFPANQQQLPPQQQW